MHQNQEVLDVLTTTPKLRLVKNFPVIEITASDAAVKRWHTMALQNKNWTKNTRPAGAVRG